MFGFARLFANAGVEAVVDGLEGGIFTLRGGKGMKGHIAKVKTAAAHFCARARALTFVLDPAFNRDLTLVAWRASAGMFAACVIVSRRALAASLIVGRRAVAESSIKDAGSCFIAAGMEQRQAVVAGFQIEVNVGRISANVVVAARAVCIAEIGVGAGFSLLFRDDVQKIHTAEQPGTKARHALFVKVRLRVAAKVAFRFKGEQSSSVTPAALVEFSVEGSVTRAPSVERLDGCSIPCSVVWTVVGVFECLVVDCFVVGCVAQRLEMLHAHDLLAQTQLLVEGVPFTCTMSHLNGLLLRSPVADCHDDYDENDAERNGNDCSANDVRHG